jgi:tRNA (cmo5U34)-methyltransferase
MPDTTEEPRTIGGTSQHPFRPYHEATGKRGCVECSWPEDHWVHASEEVIKNPGFPADAPSTPPPLPTMVYKGTEMTEGDAWEAIRRDVINEYERARRRGQTESGAIDSACFEVRVCSRQQAEDWIKEAYHSVPKPQNATLSEPGDSVEVVHEFTFEETRADDLETGNAPEAGRWEFNAEVAASFDDMLERSIPNYADMRRFVTAAAVDRIHLTRLAGYEPLIVDLGASRGAALEPIIAEIVNSARYLACEISEPMRAEIEKRFRNAIGAKRLKVTAHDLREGFPPTDGPVDVVLCVLTLQFVPVEYRQRLLHEAYERMMKGGRFLLVEKVLGRTTEISELLTRVYHGMKAENGYSEDAIQRKAASLEGVLVPLTARMNEGLLEDAGFDADCVWAWGPFRGWLAVKS